ncbi:type I phosphodiesterase/nucleotide pyrophosphatase [Gloeothece citriformis PCC 7424]|uniref:Type I phosphodiesterase/nucleotide pyrophosphatase n=1 Tax=Gloeothece citriformis (strain PCC 7424) TaxID=65393 RepID=B7KCX3_GLOC7|nr:alkaline phosphatase family protein [Gloeothece citriformis]ACK73094.1 type I phosphodiesterase/nucleotide pyrophosphatase [Gloeothece citriformis PCC 7424]
MMSQTKILFIGLDGADKDLILEWANAGLLPTFQSLSQKGAFGITDDPPGINGCHWPTFYSGVSPSKHGRYWSQQIKPGSYEIKPLDFQWQPFWKVLSLAGCKVALLDAPETTLCEVDNGIQVVERRPASSEDLSFSTYPSSLATEIETKLGKRAVGSRRSCSRDLTDIKNFRQNLLESIEKKRELISHCLNQGEWDLVLTSFRESHWVGHQCWHLHDSNHPEYDADIAKAIGNPIKDIYIAIDAAIGKILQQLSPETTVFIFASTAMGPNYTGVHLLDDILLRLENPHREIKAQNAKNTVNALKKFKFIRQLKKQILNPIRNFIGIQKSNGTDENNKNNRQCFQVPSSEAYGGIRINLVGREPEGKINPGQEYEEFCQKLCQDLLELVNVNTGEPLINKIFRSDELYQGEVDNGQPDLLVEWNRNAPIASVHSPKIGKIDKVYWDSRTGDHKIGGIFWMLGPSIKQMQIEESLSILDFAPTIASFLKISLDDGTGQSILDIVKQN